MTQRDIGTALVQAGLEAGRELSVPGDTEAQALASRFRRPSHIVRNAAVATLRHGIAWRGDVDIEREDYILRKVAVEVGENLYVIDQPSAPCKKSGPSTALIREALWWTQINRSDKDQFFSAEPYERWNTLTFPKPPTSPQAIQPVTTLFSTPSTGTNDSVARKSNSPVGGGLRIEMMGVGRGGGNAEGLELGADGGSRPAYRIWRDPYEASPVRALVSHVFEHILTESSLN